jgi:hypothetical protein
MARFFAWKAGALIAATLAAAAAQTVNLNCGGTAFTTSDGTQWSADTYFVGGDLLYTGYGIANVQQQDFYLYRSGRAGLYGDFSYLIPLPNGTYTVNLIFTEIQYTGVGDRVFNVAINGSTVLANFDILTQAPVLTPLKRQFTASVTNGVLQLDFTGVTRRALVNAIQVAPASGPGTPAGVPSLAVSAKALSFAGTAGASNPAAQSVTVSNAGTGTLVWTAASNQTWLTVSPGSGTNTGTLAIAANVAGLGAGTYSGAVTVSGGGASQTITATLTVAPDPPPAPSPALAVSTTFLSFSGTAGGSNPSAQAVGISSSGGGTLNWAASSNQGWLSVSPASGSNAGTLAASANPGSLAAGN